MDGLTLIRALRTILAETDDTSWLDMKYSYDCLYDASIATCERADVLTNSIAITSASSTASYVLPGDFLKLYMANERNEYITKYVYSAATYWLKWKPYNYIYLANHSSNATIPDCFTIRDASPLALVTGTATSAGALVTGGESTLTDTSAHFNTTSAAVNPGDFITNTQTLATGIITVVTSDTALQTAMFNNTTGESEGWSTDTYTISRQGRFSVMLDPPTADTAGVLTVPYLARPAPVYSYFRTYPFPLHFKDALVSYAAWKYKYRNQEPNFGDGYYKIWDLAVQRLAAAMNTALNRKGFRVNMIKPAQRTGTTMA